MKDDKSDPKNSQVDKYVHGMDWVKDVSEDFELKNYRKYQYNLIGKYIGKSILEVGSGDRSFTNQIVNVKGDAAGSAWRSLMQAIKITFSVFINRYG